jgi:hypothetical protein
MTTSGKYNFIRPTLKFCIVGFFIPGFTAIAIAGFQIGLVSLGIECTSAWTILWTLTTIGAVIAPIIFIRRMYRRLANGYNLELSKLLSFNLIEYTLIQCTLAMLFTNGRVLCYVTDGQNGLEFAFTGWLALPILVVLSLLFDKLRERKTEELMVENN